MLAATVLMAAGMAWAEENANLYGIPRKKTDGQRFQTGASED